MNLTGRELWMVVYGMELGAAFLLAYAGGLAGLWSLRPEWVTVVGLQQRSRRLGVGTWIMAIVAWLTVPVPISSTPGTGQDRHHRGMASATADCPVRGLRSSEGDCRSPVGEGTQRCITRGVSPQQKRAVRCDQARAIFPGCHATLALRIGSPIPQ